MRPSYEVLFIFTGFWHLLRDALAICGFWFFCHFIDLFEFLWLFEFFKAFKFIEFVIKGDLWGFFENDWEFQFPEKLHISFDQFGQLILKDFIAFSVLVFFIICDLYFVEEDEILGERLLSMMGEIKVGFFGLKVYDIGCGLITGDQVHEHLRHHHYLLLRC